MKLQPEYTHRIDTALAAQAWLESQSDEGRDADFDDGEALFDILCHGVRMYVDAWKAFGHPGIGGIVSTGEDMDDPIGRITDPHAMTRTLLRLALDAISDNITHDLDAEIERGEAS